MTVSTRPSVTRRLGQAGSFLLVVGLIACGGQPAPDAESDSRESTAPADSVDSPEGLPLRFLLLEPVGEKSRVLREFEREHGVELVFDVGRWDPDGGAEYSLVEVDYWTLGDHIGSQHLAPLPADREWLTDWWADECVRREDQVWGVPWRGRLHGIRLPDPVGGAGEGLASWATLGRLTQRLGGLGLPAATNGSVDPGALISVWLANGTSFWGSPTPGPEAEVQLSQPAAVEGLEFLVRLHRGAPVAGPAALEAHVGAGGLAAGSPRGAKDLHWIPWPTPEGDHRIAWAEPWVLALPRQGPHGGLAAEFLAFLGSQPAGALFARPPGGRLHSLHRGSREVADTAVRSLPAVQDGRRLRDVLSEGLGAALESRRSPQDALRQAQSRWMTVPVDDGPAGG